VRVLVFTGLYPRPSRPQHGVFIRQRLAPLAERHELVVVSPQPFWPPAWECGPGREYAAWARDPEAEVVDGVPVYRPRYPFLPKIGIPFQAAAMALATLPLVARLAARSRFDLIDTHYLYPDGVAAAMIAGRLDLPIMSTARGTDVNVLLKRRDTGPQVRWSLRRVTAVATVSAALGEALHDGALGAVRPIVIPNGVDGDRFRPGDRARARARLDLPADARVVLTVAAWKGPKGILRAMEAVDALPGEMDPVVHCLVGAGPLAETMKEKAAEARHPARFRLVGEVPHDDLAPWYHAADVTLLASEREGWPNVLTESVACGIPVVATPVGGVPEIVREGHSGILAPPEGLEAALRAALSRGWDVDEVRRGVGERTWEDVSREVESVWSRISAGSGPAPAPGP
jgi:glycosyltransferase involved in cell wall biosynthesis